MEPTSVDRRDLQHEYQEQAADQGLLSSVGPTISIETDPKSGRPERVRLDEQPADVGRRAGARVRYLAISFGLLASDALCVVIALLCSYFIRFDSFSAPILGAVTGASLLWVAVFGAFGLYAPHRLGPEEEFRRILGASSMGLMLIVLGTYWVHFQPSRVWMGLTFLLALVLELAVRRIWRSIVWRLKRNGWLSLRTLVIVDGADVSRILSALSKPDLGLNPLGYVSREGLLVAERGTGDKPLLGSFDELDSIIVEHKVDCLFVATTGLDSLEMLTVIQAARRHLADLRILTNLSQVLSSRVNVHQVGNLTTLGLRSTTLTGFQAIIKRLSDVVISILALVILSPLLLAVALLVRATSVGPVLYQQQRITAGGRPFTMYKFRTMVANADHIMSRQRLDKTAPFFKLNSGSLLTPVGAFLRRASLDELPQLFNVLKGEMSLVGPRPLPAEQVAANADILGSRHEVRAGMTGWWQINGRKVLDAEESIRMDLFYIENWSLSLDMYILLRTIGALFSQRGAY